MWQSARSPLSRALVAAVLSDSPKDRQVQRFITHCQGIAVAYLRRRERSGRLDLEAFGLTLEDLALDCLADLFERNDRGEFPRLQAAFDPSAWSDDVDAEISVRRVIFSVVGEGLFRRYQEADPGLGRMIRNLKRHAKRVEGLELRRLHGVLNLVLAESADDAFARPLMPSELLEIYLHPALSASSVPADVLAAWVDVVRAAPQYAPRCPVTVLALASRSVDTRLHATEDNVVVMPTYEEKDLAQVVEMDVERAVEEVSARLREYYVQQRAVEPTLFQAYVQVVRMQLLAHFAKVAVQPPSIRASLGLRLEEEVSRDAYRTHHQAMLEYLLRVTRARLLERAAVYV